MIFYTAGSGVTFNRAVYCHKIALDNAEESEMIKGKSNNKIYCVLRGFWHS